MKTVTQMTRKEFNALPSREWGEDIGPFQSLIILPRRGLHDSGYRLMDFVAVRDGIPVCRLSGCSDVLHIDGIGGYGRFRGALPEAVPPKDWTIDCLPKSGLLQIFGPVLTCGPALSSFELYGERKK